MSTRQKSFAVFLVAVCCLLSADYCLLATAYCDNGDEPTTEAAQIKDPIETKSGPITGEVKDGVRSYKGIPYAAAPVGKLRWKPPRAHKPWKEPRPAREFGPSCPQHKDEVSKGLGKMDEDCLYLNVWTPAKTESDKLPVMVWIHGGGFIIGSGSMAPYHGANLAKEGVVVVTINYRLGVFGFLAHPALSKESPKNTSGNYGLMDQIFALKWVRDNIAKFGGDPGNVTIFGESAGAVSVCLLIACPLARGLFHRGIAQSGGASPSLAYLKKDSEHSKSAEAKGVKYAKSLGATKLNDAIVQLRRKSWQEILEADKSRITLPGSAVPVCIDRHVLPDSPLDIIKSGRGAKVPLLTGTNKDEGTIFTSRVRINTLPKLRVFLSLFLKDRKKVEEALKLYGVKDNASAKKAFSDMLGDGFVVSARRTARAHAGAGNKTYLYHFTRTLPWAERLGFGCFHGFEITYVFGTHPVLRGYKDADRKISKDIMGYWTRFAKTGDPNGADMPRWPLYKAKEDKHLVIDTEIKVGKNLRKKYCDFFDSLRIGK